MKVDGQLKEINFQENGDIEWEWDWNVIQRVSMDSSYRMDSFCAVMTL